MTSQNKTGQALQKEYEAVKEEISTLKNKQARLKLHIEMEHQGVSRSEGTWFVAGSSN